MARLVTGDLAADPREVFLSLSGGELSHVSVGDPGRTLLKRCVNEPLVLVIPARREAISDQMMDGPLDREHVHAARKPEVRIEQVAVPILFRGPPPQPSGPRSGRRARRVPGDVLQRDAVVRQGLFRDQITYQNDQQIVGSTQRGLAKSREVPGPIVRGQVGQVVGRLPGLIHRCEQEEVLLDEPFQVFNQFHARLPFLLNCLFVRIMGRQSKRTASTLPIASHHTEHLPRGHVRAKLVLLGRVSRGIVFF